MQFSLEYRESKTKVSTLAKHKKTKGRREGKEYLPPPHFHAADRKKGGERVPPTNPLPRRAGAISQSEFEVNTCEH